MRPDVSDTLVKQGCGLLRADVCGDCGPDWLPQGRLQTLPRVCFKGKLFSCLSIGPRLESVLSLTFGMFMKKHIWLVSFDSRSPSDAYPAILQKTRFTSFLRPDLVVTLFAFSRGPFIGCYEIWAPSVIPKSEHLILKWPISDSFSHPRTHVWRRRGTKAVFVSLWKSVSMFTYWSINITAPRCSADVDLCFKRRKET